MFLLLLTHLQFIQYFVLPFPSSNSFLTLILLYFFSLPDIAQNDWSHTSGLVGPKHPSTEEHALANRILSKPKILCVL